MTPTAQATRVSVVAGPLVSPVLRRVVGMLAARADLPLDRLDEAVLIADLIAARAAHHVSGETVDVEMEPGDRALTLRLGPLRRGGAHALVEGAAVPGVGNVIEQLADTLDVEANGEASEFLTVSLRFREAPPV